MMEISPLLNDDILDYLKRMIDISEYDKMKKVSVMYRELFDLSKILYNQRYDILICIKGTSVEMILKMIDSNVRKKYKFKKNKHIIKKLLLYEELLEESIKYNNTVLIEYLLDILYNTANKKYENIKNTLTYLYDNEKNCCTKMNRLAPMLKIIITYVLNMSYHRVELECLYKLNVSTLLFMIVKKYSKSKDNSYTMRRSTITNLFTMQNKKIDDYITVLEEEHIIYQDTKYFKKKYIDFMKTLIKTLHIEITSGSGEEGGSGDEGVGGV